MALWSLSSHFVRAVVHSAVCSFDSLLVRSFGRSCVAQFVSRLLVCLFVSSFVYSWFSFCIVF